MSASTWARVLILWGALAFVVSGQVRISFSQEGPEQLKTGAGRLIKGFGLASVDVCNLGAGRVVDSGMVFSEIRKLGVSVVTPALADATLERSLATSGPSVALDVAGASTGAIGLAGGFKAIKMSNGWAIGLSLLPAGIDLVKLIFGKRVPNPKPIIDNMLKGTYTLSPQACIPASVFVFVYDGKWNPKEVIVP